MLEGKAKAKMQTKPSVLAHFPLAMCLGVGGVCEETRLCFNLCFRLSFVCVGVGSFFWGYILQAYL
jgi:hypothetical protein